MRIDFHVDMGRVDFSAAGVRAVTAASSAIRETAFAIEAKAKLICPYDTGNLRSSISTTTGHLSAEIGPTAEYGHFLEYGTSRMAPRPYMGPAADSEMPMLEQRINRLLGGFL